jgi:hypothetical protein
MFRSVPNLLGQMRIGFLSCCAILTLSLAISGCCSPAHLRGESYPEDELSSFIGQFRQPGGDDDAFVFSNKAKQINRNLGGSRPIR